MSVGLTLLPSPARLFDQGIKLSHIRRENYLKNDNICISDDQELCSLFQVKLLTNGFRNDNLSFR